MSAEQDNRDRSEFVRHLLGTGPSMEIITLKGHLWIETRLRTLLATRLHVSEDRLPRLSFVQVAQLACCGLPGNIVENFILVNQIRNSLAHEMHPPDQSERIRRLVELTGEGPWPDTTEEQMIVYANALANTAGFVKGLIICLSGVQQSSVPKAVSDSGDA